MKEIIVVKIFESASTDGYTSIGDGRFFIEEIQADNEAKMQHGNYASRPKPHLAIEIERGKYILVKSKDPVCIESSKAAKEREIHNALSKLSSREKEILGLLKEEENK